MYKRKFLLTSHVDKPLVENIQTINRQFLCFECEEELGKSKSMPNSYMCFKCGREYMGPVR